MYGAYVCMVAPVACGYLIMRIGGDRFFGLLGSDETAIDFINIVACVGAISTIVGVVCSVYSLYFGNFKTRLACIIPAVILSRLFIQIAGGLFTKMLDWL